MKFFPFAFFLLFGMSAMGQAPVATQNIRGIVQDKTTKQPLVGAVVNIVGLQRSGTLSAEDGSWVLTNVPIGRVGVRCGMVGYQPFEINDIILTSTKEVFLEINLNEGAIETGEVVVSAAKNAFEAVNPLSVVSTRSFTAEETDRVPAGINDPGRVALSFPGVKQGPDETENAIIVRGNSPVGILWRVEGIDMPNPNHFALIGSSVGGVNVFSAQLLSRSDFSSGGMAAEYGNALSGAFDIHFRQGNFEQREHRLKIGLIGLDFATEGPIKKGQSSYLVNYRYSTLGLLNRMGFHLVGERVSNDFQDMSFNLAFKTRNPKVKATLFGIGGLSLEQYFPVSDAAQRDSVIFNHRQVQYKPAKMGAIGTTWAYLPNSKSYFKAVVALVGSDIRRQNDTVNAEDIRFRYHTEQFTDRRLSASLTYNLKISEKTRLKAGIIGHQIFFDFYRDVVALSSIDNISNIERGGTVLGDGNTQLVQQYTQLMYQLHPKLAINGGYHAVWLAANGTYAVDPRLSMQFTPTNTQKISLAYSQQSQHLPLMTYFFKDSTGTFVNRDLKMLQAQHLVLAYHLYTRSKMKISFEAYYQQLQNVPVIPDANNLYWMLNNTQGYPTFRVVGEGSGTNYGLDAAIERLFSGGYYVLATGSWMQSKYRPYNGREYNSRWAAGFSSSLTAGKEFKLRRGRVLQFGGRFLYSGNGPYTPYDPVLSAQQGTYVALKDAENTARLPNYYRLDTRVQYRYNARKLSGSISLDIQNVLNRANATGVGYDAGTNTTYIQYRGGGLIPVLAFQFDL